MLTVKQVCAMKAAKYILLKVGVEKKAFSCVSLSSKKLNLFLSLIFKQIIFLDLYFKNKDLLFCYIKSLIKLNHFLKYKRTLKYGWYKAAVALIIGNPPLALLLKKKEKYCSKAPKIRFSCRFIKILILKTKAFCLVRKYSIIHSSLFYQNLNKKGLYLKTARINTFLYERSKEKKKVLDSFFNKKFMQLSKRNNFLTLQV